MIDTELGLVLDKLKGFGIKVDERHVAQLQNTIALYQHGNTIKYPLWLVVRELGGQAWYPQPDQREPYSPDVSTVVLEEYFRNYKGLRYILEELKQITKGNFAVEVLEETPYEEEEEEVRLTFAVHQQEQTVVHTDEFGDGTLLFEFVTNELLPKLKGAITKGTVLYWGEEAFTFIYLAEEAAVAQLVEELKVSRL